MDVGENLWFITECCFAVTLRGGPANCCRLGQCSPVCACQLCAALLFLTAVK
jgi:hypothetical protein